MNFKHLLFEANHQGLQGVGLLTLNRPSSLNALNREVIEELQGFLKQAKADKSLRVLIVTGAGEKAFVAGADIKEMQNFSREEALQMAVRGQSTFDHFESAPFVSVAAVNGFALGGGLELAMACDVIVASKTAKFGLPEVSLGLIPGYGGTQRLARFIGKAKARLVAVTGDIFPAQQGYEWGLFAQITEPAELMPSCLKIAKSVAARAPMAVALAKQAINEGFDMTQAEGLIHESELFAQTFTTDDRREGISAFIEKRPPTFKGE